MILSNNLKKVLVISAIIASGIAITNGYKTMDVLQKKAVAQSEVTDGVYQWRQSYMAMRSVLDKWNSTYKNDEDVQDLISLYQLIGLHRFGLKADPDSFSLTNIESVQMNGTHIGLTKICLSSGRDTGTYLQVASTDYESLFRGVTDLANQSDVYIENISIKGGKSEAIAYLGGFCYMLRGI